MSGWGGAQRYKLQVFHLLGTGAINPLRLSASARLALSLSYSASMVWAQALALDIIKPLVGLSVFLLVPGGYQKLKARRRVI